jgi:hypothetical protein
MQAAVAAMSREGILAAVALTVRQPLLTWRRIKTVVQRSNHTTATT